MQTWISPVSGFRKPSSLVDTHWIWSSENTGATVSSKSSLSSISLFTRSNRVMASLTRSVLKSGMITLRLQEHTSLAKCSLRMVDCCKITSRSQIMFPSPQDIIRFMFYSVSNITLLQWSRQHTDDSAPLSRFKPWVFTLIGCPPIVTYKSSV